MPDGFYGTGDPWTFIEGRTCAGHDDTGCGSPLPDVTDRFGNFSNHCSDCRPQYKKKLIASYPDRHKKRRTGAPEKGVAPKDRTRSADIWKAALVEAVGTGISVAEGCRRIGVSYPAYERQSERDPNFRAKIRAARLQGRGASTFQERVPLAFGEFAQKYFHRTHYAHQLRMIDEIDRLDAQDVAMILMPPESGKTATIEDYICRKLAVDPTHRFRVISESTDLATRIVGACSRRFTDTEIYPGFIGNYGPFYEKGQERASGKPWTSSQLTLWKNPATERDRNLVAQSWSGTNYGSRIDTLIIDDVTSQRNFSQSQEIFERIRGTFFNRGVEIKIIIVGTRIKPGDFYDKMDDAGLITRHLYLPATGSLGAEPGYPTTPEMWQHRLKHSKRGAACCPPGIDRVCPENGEWLTPKEFLELIRFKAGEDTWWASYMQNPRNDAVSTFGEALEDCKDLVRMVGPLKSANLTMMSIDPALGGGTALVVADCRSDRLTILDSYTVRGLARTEQQIELIRQYALRYRPAILIVEYDAQQKGLGNDDRLRALGRELGFTIVPHITRGQKVDVPYAVASMNQSFAKREISIPWGDAEAKGKMEQLVHQLRGWRIPEKGKRDTQVQDLVMALWFIWRHWMQTRGVKDQRFTRQRRPSWLMPDLRRSGALTGGRR